MNNMRHGIVLTVEEIRDLAQFAGFIIKAPTDPDEKETEIRIEEWPSRGVMDDDGPVPPHRHIAYFDEYPDEGCIPLGSPNVPDHRRTTKTR